MKRLTILDEGFIETEIAATNALQEAASLINKTVLPILSISINESEELRFSPSFIEVKANLNPVESVNRVVNRICESISLKKKLYTLKEAAVISEIFNKLNHIDTLNMSALDEAISFFGSNDNIKAINLKEGNLEVNDSALVECRKKLNSLRESCGLLLSKLNNATRNNNLTETTETLQELALLREFVNYL